jgi:HD-GYP domain-containing protein (c-di-GMP phosphodiesterase class II)
MMTCPAATSSQNGALAGYTAVPAAILIALPDSRINIYVADESKKRPILFRAGDYCLTREQWKQLGHGNTRYFYVRNSDWKIFSTELNNGLDAFLEREEIPVSQRVTVLQTAALDRFQSAYQAIKVDAAIEESQRFGQRISQLLRIETVLPKDLFALFRHDSNALTHVLNVVAYSAVLAKEMRYSPEEQSSIAIGAMMHDLGKRFIPAYILAYPGPLNAEEKQIIQLHPQKGYVDLVPKNSLSRDQLMMVYQHHEWIDGNGYPVGLSGDEIHPWAKLCAVADVFEALTGNRPYRRAFTLAQSLQYLEQMSSTQLDREIVQCWIRAMKKT